jgi:hypothetical protein
MMVVSTIDEIVPEALGTRVDRNQPGAPMPVLIVGSTRITWTGLAAEESRTRAFPLRTAVGSLRRLDKPAPAARMQNKTS